MQTSKSSCSYFALYPYIILVYLKLTADKIEHEIKLNFMGRFEHMQTL
jgi:hypothetical protein